MYVSSRLIRRRGSSFARRPKNTVLLIREFQRLILFADWLSCCGRFCGWQFPMRSALLWFLLLLLPPDPHSWLSPPLLFLYRLVWSDQKVVVRAPLVFFLCFLSALLFPIVPWVLLFLSIYHSFLFVHIVVHVCPFLLVVVCHLHILYHSVWSGLWRICHLRCLIYLELMCSFASSRPSARSRRVSIIIVRLSTFRHLVSTICGFLSGISVPIISCSIFLLCSFVLLLVPPLVCIVRLRLVLSVVFSVIGSFCVVLAAACLLRNCWLCVFPGLLHRGIPLSLSLPIVFYCSVHAAWPVFSLLVAVIFCLALLGFPPRQLSIL